MRSSFPVRTGSPVCAGRLTAIAFVVGIHGPCCDSALHGICITGRGILDQPTKGFFFMIRIMYKEVFLYQPFRDTLSLRLSAVRSLIRRSKGS